MKITKHQIFYQDSSKMPQIPDESVDLVVTSPSYPFIEMWDDLIFELDDVYKRHLSNNLLGADHSNFIFRDVHEKMFDNFYYELHRVVKNGGIVCINIGDAVRKFGIDFCLYPNHVMIQNRLNWLGFHSLPSIIWRKPTNSPNKFMGSGTLPVNAYVTLEHEHILIFRKGTKRSFSTPKQRGIRNESAIFWEERNIWYSDLWQISGTPQKIDTERGRSGAFPVEIPHRLINMYSIKGDTVLDPFLGTGTTTLAAIASERNSIGFEIDDSLHKFIEKNAFFRGNIASHYNTVRLRQHLNYVKDNPELFQGDFVNKKYGFKVKTKPEINIILREVKSITGNEDNSYEVFYDDEFPRQTALLERYREVLQ